MAKNDASKVTSAKPNVGGALFVAPAKTALPTDTKTALPAAFVSLGYVGEDGFKNSVSTETKDIKAYGGDTVLTVRTSRAETITATLIQSTDQDVLKAVYGEGNVTDSTGTLKVRHNGADLPHQVFVSEHVLADGRIKRLVIPDGQITEVGEITYKDGEVVGYPVTISCYPNAEGDTVIEYIGAAK